MEKSGYRSMLAAAPEPPANSQGSLDGSGDPVLAQLVEALKTSITAIDDWLHIYAEELCNEADVAASKARVHANGTLAYIAEVQERSRAALAAAEDEENKNKD